MARPILVVGSSGQAGSVIDAVEQGGAFRIAGLLDRFRPMGSIVHGYSILGGEADISRLRAEHCIEGVAVAIGDNWGRSESVRLLLEQAPDLSFVTVVHPAATVSSRATAGSGTVVLAGAVVGANCKLAQFCIVNTNSSIDHDCILGAYSSIAPGATLGGNVTVGAFSAVCLGANIVHGCRVGEHTVLGAGATLLSDLSDHVVAYGLPARPVRTRATGEPYL